MQSPLFVFINDKYANATTELQIDALVEKHACFLKDEKSGGMLLQLRDPLASDASITDPDDRKLIEALLEVISRATPLSPLLKGAMAGSNAEEGSEAGLHLKFDGSVCMPVDTEHWKLDSRINKKILAERKGTIGVK